MATADTDRPLCAGLEVQLIDFALGDVGPGETQHHLETCARCRRVVESNRAIWAAAASLPKFRPGPERRSGVLAAASQSLQGPAPSSSRAGWTFGEVSDAPTPTAHTGAIGFNQSVTADMRPGRDVRAHVLHAAAAVAAGVTPISVEQFKHVPLAASSPPAVPGSDNALPRSLLPVRGRLALAVGVALVAVSIALLWGQLGGVPKPAPEPSDIFREPPATVAPSLEPASKTSNTLRPTPVPVAEQAPPEMLRPAVVPPRRGQTADGQPPPTVSPVPQSPSAVVSDRDPGKPPVAELFRGRVFDPDSLPVDARVRFMAQVLTTTSDPKVRIQTVTILGGTQSPAAVAPLCEAMHDSEVAVRVAAARALARIGQSGALACLKELTDTERAVRLEIEAAIHLLEQPRKTPVALVTIDPISVDGSVVSPDEANILGSVLRESLGLRGVAMMVTEAEDGGAPTPAGSPSRYRLSLKASTSGATGLRLELSVKRYPREELMGSWNVKASGGSHEALMKVMIPRIVGDVAEDLQWSTPEPR